MIQIVFHGLGGQGAKSAAQILADAAFGEGKEIQAFPEFGPERRGAPVRAFVRISDRPITTHEPITKPDYTVIIEPTMVTMERMEGVCIVNSKETAEQVKRRTGFEGSVHVIDAGALSQFANLPMLGALVKVSGVVRFESVERCVREQFEKKLGVEKTAKMIDAVRTAHGMVG